MPEGYAETRLGHTPMQVMPDKDYYNKFGNTWGSTEFSAFGKPSSYIPQSTIEGHPEVLRHEAIHAFLGPKQGGVPPEQAAKLIQPNYLSNYYPDQSARAAEVPARLTTDPSSVGMTVDTGRDAMRQYLELLRRSNPSLATRLSRHLGLAGSEQGDKTDVLQRPNDVF